MRKLRTNEPDAPPWLLQMRALTGTKEVPGPEANPVIVGMTDTIAATWPTVPGMEAYCDQPAWDSDETAWCGVAAGYCLSLCDLMVPFGPTDTDRFGWADSYRTQTANFINLGGPVFGCIVVMKRSGGNHVTFLEEDDGSTIKCRGGNQSNSVNVTTFNKSDVTGWMWPKAYPTPPVPRSNVEEGDTGPQVVSIQNSLGIVPADGDFGPITEGGVKGFQRACSLSADGEVGPDTWNQLDALDARVAAGGVELSPDTIAQIVDVAEGSAIASYSWRDRGRAPLGYTAGIALCFADALVRLDNEEADASEMSIPNTGDSDKDVFAWYKSKFDGAGMPNGENNSTEQERLRHLFALMLGLGMRESSGRYCEGRDMSASNVQSDTAEAGMFQTSWNIRSCNGSIPPLLTEFWANPLGYREQFQNGVSPDSNDLDNFGSGDGAQYQFLSKYAPLFHALVTGVGLRFLRQHWGPINRSEAELKKDADTMLQAVQEIVAGSEPPVPGPDPGQARVDITAAEPVTVNIQGDVWVTVNGEHVTGD